MALRWSRDALRDLDDIFDFVSKRNPQAAHDVIARIRARARTLLQQPAMGRIGRVHGTREFVLGDLPYVLPYRVTADAVEIVRVLHGARQWPPDEEAS